MNMNIGMTNTGLRNLAADINRQLDQSDGRDGGVEILRAAKCLSTLLFDATEGDAKITIELDGQHIAPALVLSTLLAG